MRGTWAEAGHRVRNPHPVKGRQACPHHHHPGLAGHMAEGVGFEPTEAFTSPVFKTGAINRSTIPPFERSCFAGLLQLRCDDIYFMSFRGGGKQIKTKPDEILVLKFALQALLSCHQRKNFTRVQSTRLLLDLGQILTVQAFCLGL